MYSRNIQEDCGSVHAHGKLVQAQAGDMHCSQALYRPTEKYRLREPELLIRSETLRERSDRDMSLIFTYVRGKCRHRDDDRQYNAGGKKKNSRTYAVLWLSQQHMLTPRICIKELERHAFTNPITFINNDDM